MSDIPPVDRSKRMLTDGSPVPEDYSHTRDRGDGQQVGYVVLSDEERAKGWVKPYRDSYVHEKCGTLTKMGRSLSETYARDPRFYSGTFCVGCGAHFTLDQFHWADGEPMDPDLQEGWRDAEFKRQREESRKAQALLEATERAELARLKAKYES